MQFLFSYQINMLNLKRQNIIEILTLLLWRNLLFFGWMNTVTQSGQSDYTVVMMRQETDNVSIREKVIKKE